MKHRHLLPNEIDLLVDGEAGFGVVPLRAHLQECSECRAWFENARLVAEALETLPHFAPQTRLADRVMARVPVFVPAHAAARESFSRWLPQSYWARVAAVSFAAAVGGALTLALLWLATRADAVLFVSGLLGDRLRGVAADAARHLVVALLGQSALTALQSAGPVGTTMLVLGVVVSAGSTVVAIRRLATVGARRS